MRILTRKLVTSSLTLADEEEDEGTVIEAQLRHIWHLVADGATESIEGKHGLLVGYSDNAHPDKAVAGLGEIYETMKIGIKPYPSCRYTHAALDALIAMRREHNLTPDQVKRVEIGLHRNGITLTGDAATKRHPTSIVGGQFSIALPFGSTTLTSAGGVDERPRPISDSAADTSSPSAGSSSHPRTYSRPPKPPKTVRMTKPTRISTGSTPNARPRPPATPAIFRSFAERRGRRVHQSPPGAPDPAVRSCCSLLMQEACS